MRKSRKFWYAYKVATRNGELFGTFALQIGVLFRINSRVRYHFIYHVGGLGRAGKGKVKGIWELVGAARENFLYQCALQGKAGKAVRHEVN